MRAQATKACLDIVAALEWVHKHISVFGGDPNNVMIFGESGGGAKTSCLYAMPAAAPYFNKASIESGPGVRMLTREMAAETTAMVLQALNIAPNDWRKLLDVPAADLLRIQSQFPPIPPHRQQRKTGESLSRLPRFRAGGGWWRAPSASVRPDRPSHFQQ